MLLALLFAAGTPAIAVLDARAGPGVDPSLGPYLAQVLASEVQSRTGVAPLSSADITAMLGFERNKKLLGCDDEESSECIAEITGALGVAQVLASSVAIANGRYLVSVSLLDSRHARPLKRAAESSALDQDALVHAVKRAAWEIFGGAEPPAVAAPAQATSTGPSRRTWAMVAGGGAVLLAGAGIVVGASALSQAKEASPDALSRAHVADALYATAIAAAGLGAYLWFTAPGATVAVAPSGAGAVAVVAW